MNISFPFKPKNMDESHYMEKLRKYRESVQEDLTTASDILRKDTSNPITSTEKSYHLGVTNPRFENSQSEHNMDTRKLRKYKESGQEHAATDHHSRTDDTSSNPPTSTERSYDTGMTSPLAENTHNERNETVQNDLEVLVPTVEHIQNRTTKPESAKMDEFNEKANRNLDKEVNEETELNAEAFLETNVPDKSDRRSSQSEISGLFSDNTEDQFFKDNIEDDKVLDADSYYAKTEDAEAPSEKLDRENKKPEIGTEDTTPQDAVSYLSTTGIQGVKRLSIDSLSSASDQISKLPSSHRSTSVEDVMYIDLELDDTTSRQHSYYSTYTFSESVIYHWDTSSRLSSITDNDEVSTPSSVITHNDFITPTRVVTNVPSYQNTQTSLGNGETVYPSPVPNERDVTDYLSQKLNSHSSIESSFSVVDSTSDTATNTLEDISRIILESEMGELNNIKLINSTGNYMFQLLHPLKTSKTGLPSQNINGSEPFESENYLDVTNSHDDNAISSTNSFQTVAIDVTNGNNNRFLTNDVTQALTNSKEIFLHTSLYGPITVKSKEFIPKTTLEPELITSMNDDIKITSSGFPERSYVSPSLEVTTAMNTEVLSSKETKPKSVSTESILQESDLNTPITVTSSEDYLSKELETISPLEQTDATALTSKQSSNYPESVSIATPTGPVKEQDSSTPNVTTASSDNPVTPGLENSKSDFRTTAEDRVTPSKPCDWSKLPDPTASPAEYAQEGIEAEEDMKEMKLPTYVYLRLSHAWPVFCNKQKDIRNRFSRIYAEDKDTKVEPRQIMFAGVKHCNCSKIQHHHRGVKIYVYTVDTEGNYSENLTKELEVRLQILQRRKLSAEREVEEEICEVSIYRVPSKSEVTEASNKMSSSGMIAAISISAIAGICLILMFTMLLILKQRQEKDHNSASSSDSYSMDSFAARGSSGRRKRPRLSIRSFLNQAFDEPEIPNHPLNFNSLSSVLQNKTSSELEDEFKNIPMDVPRSDTLPQGAETKNRYANVIPVPETRVPLSSNGEQPGYINANYVKGYGGKSKTYIACQAPLEETTEDFWRMVWEQQSRVVVMLTQLEENGVSRCAPYFPENTVDCHRLYGDFQVTLLEKDVRENFIKSSLRLHDLEKNLFRDVVHVWYTAWPSQGVPEDSGIFMGFILEFRTMSLRNSGPVVVHCSPGTGRTGTFIATDICMHEYQESRCVDILRCVARLRQDRSGAVQTFNQYLFIHEVLHEYAMKLGTQSHRPSLMSLVSLKLSHQER